MVSSIQRRRPDVSIIIPLHDYRFQAEFIALWSNGQDYPRELYEVIVIAAPEHLPLKDEIMACLNEQDSWLEYDGNRSDRYHQGCLEAKGEVLFVTEDHCRPLKHCLSEVMQPFASGQTELVIPKAGHENRNSLAQTEAAYYSGVVDTTDWNCVKSRGTAIRRDLYFAAGGFEGRYGMFAETWMGMKISDRSRTIGKTSRTCLLHVNSYEWSHLMEDIYDLAFGECLCRMDHPAGDLDKFLDTPVRVLIPHSDFILHARYKFNATWRSALRLIYKSFNPLRVAKQLGNAALFLHQSRSGYTGACAQTRWAAKMDLIWARATPPNHPQQMKRFGVLMSRTVQEAFMVCHLDHANCSVERPGLSVGCNHPAKEVRAEYPDAFYRLKESNDHPFCWSTLCGAVSVQCTPGEYLIIWETGSILDLKKQSHQLPVFLWNGREIPCDVQADGQLRMRVTQDPNDGERGHLIWAGMPKYTLGPRQLGIPLVSLRIRKIS